MSTQAGATENLEQVVLSAEPDAGLISGHRDHDLCENQELDA